jgi:hypothetical protein
MPTSKHTIKPGDVFGRLTILYAEGWRRRNYYWRCLCACGVERSVVGTSLRNGQQSCGCLAREQSIARNKTHGALIGGIASPEYTSWKSMMDRCTLSSHTAFHNYGGRGIRVCERWKKFENFLADLGSRPPACSLDRYPNKDGNYEPQNVRWATREQQGINRRTSHVVEYNGEQLTVRHIADRFGHAWHYTYKKLFLEGLSLDAAIIELQKPTRRGKNKIKRGRSDEQLQRRV